MLPTGIDPTGIEPKGAESYSAPDEPTIASIGICWALALSAG